MNLGQLIGEQKLRIWQLEDELNRRGIRMPSPAITAPVPQTIESTTAAGVEYSSQRRGVNRGLGARVYAAIPDCPPGFRVSEIAKRLGDVPNQTISSFLCQFDDVAHTGERGSYRYYRKAAA